MMGSRYVVVKGYGTKREAIEWTWLKETEFCWHEQALMDPFTMVKRNYRLGKWDAVGECGR